LDARSDKRSIEGGVDRLRLGNDVESSSPGSDAAAELTTLASIAADQINVAGPEFIGDKG